MLLLLRGRAGVLVLLWMAENVKEKKMAARRMVLRAPGAAPQAC